MTKLSRKTHKRKLLKLNFVYFNNRYWYKKLIRVTLPVTRIFVIL